MEGEYINVLNEDQVKELVRPIEEALALLIVEVLLSDDNPMAIQIRRAALIEFVNKHGHFARVYEEGV